MGTHGGKGVRRRSKDEHYYGRHRVKGSGSPLAIWGEAQAAEAERLRETEVSTDEAMYDTMEVDKELSQN